MDLNRIINMVTHQLIRRVVNMAVDGGLRFASRKTAELTKPDPEPGVANDMSAQAELTKDEHLRSLSDRAATVAKLTGRIGR